LSVGLGADPSLSAHSWL